MLKKLLLWSSSYVSAFGKKKNILKNFIESEKNF